MAKNVVWWSAQSAMNRQDLSPEQQDVLSLIFPWLEKLTWEGQEEVMKGAQSFVKDKIKTLDKPKETFTEFLQNKDKHNKEMSEAKAVAQDEKDKKIAALYEQLSIKDKELTQANKDLDATTQIEFGPINLIKLALIKRQQKKLDYFMKEDPEAGMRYAYYNGVFWVRHIKRALNKRWIIQMNPEKTYAKMEEYIDELKDKADTPKKQAVVRRLAEHAKIVNDRYVDVYDKRRKWPKKFNSAA